MKDIIKGDTGDFELVIGLEVHAQVMSNSKLFSGSSTKFGALPNTQVSFVDAAYPGMLPVVNEYCIEQAVKTGLALEAEINLNSVFDRKNYFYADLPQGYQISQFFEPIVRNGQLSVKSANGEERVIEIERIHLEQDAGKSIHDQSPTESFIDLNRAGIALMEIVSKPVIYSAYEAGEYIKQLRKILRYVGSCDGDMEKGNLRCDANVSVRRVGQKELGTRCEIKNLNSFRNIMRAIEYEANLQVKMIESGEKIIQSTKLFNDSTGQTRTIRTKEDAEDYRYFPEPDLLPVKLTSQYVDKIRLKLPELPNDRKKRYVNDFALNSDDADVLTEEIEVANYFDKVVSCGVSPKLAANWIISELFAVLNKMNLDIANSPVKYEQLADLIKLIETNIISGKIAKSVFEKICNTGKNPKIIVEEDQLVQITDKSSIEKIIDEILLANEGQVQQYRNGKTNIFGFFVGEVMKKTKGKANPNIVNELLKDKL